MDIVIRVKRIKDMKTFNFTDEEKCDIIKYLLSHRMKRKGSYTCAEWEKIKKQRIRARMPIKEVLNAVGHEKAKLLSKLNFDTLTVKPRIGIDDNNQVFHIPVDEEHLNEEITNLLRKLVKPLSKYLY